jgi:ABC-2 type transport system permease protein
MSASPEPVGTIYDIGYRHYDGPRLGRRGAIAAIVGAGLRASFGLGRSGRSKIIPWGALVLALIPAGVAVAVRVLVGDLIDLYSYSNYLWGIGALFPIFVAAQAPELVVNDMRHRVLPLYFSRPIGRFDYITAKLAALSLALLALTLLPVLILFEGCWPRRTSPRGWEMRSEPCLAFWAAACCMPWSSPPWALPSARWPLGAPTRRGRSWPSSSSAV